ncbi:ANR family transcriptional regulator [Vibrio paucivorans]
METQEYLTEARIAVLLEKKKQYHAAMHQWHKARLYALVRANQLWAHARADFCNKQHEEEKICHKN